MFDGNLDAFFLLQCPQRAAQAKFKGTLVPFEGVPSIQFNSIDTTTCTRMSYKQLLKESWSTIANEYKSNLVPRFKPWIEDAVEALSSANPPTGSIFVAGCGTGEVKST